MNEEAANKLNSIDLEDLIPRMEYYLLFRLKGIGEKDLGGLTLQDFIFNVIEKVLLGVRHWDESKGIKFEEFLFGCLKSEISEFYRKQRNTTSQIPENHVSSSESELEVSEIRDLVTKFLNENRATKLELDIFECWAEGIVKRKEVAYILDVLPAEIDNGTKRLLRKLNVFKVNNKWIHE
ncbi:MAG: hypothetical protein R8P61_23155 [Bacteroidia bacterium]|nr:hypothetical protein [Bacteroidia bacterium]